MFNDVQERGKDFLGGRAGGGGGEDIFSAEFRKTRIKSLFYEKKRRLK